MKIATVKLRSVTPYSMSRFHNTPKLSGEKGDEYEERTWREKAHYNLETLEVYIPPMALKMSLDEAAQFRGEQIPGKGKATYRKHFLAGILVTDPVYLGVTRDQLTGESHHCDSKGQRGGSSRVIRKFPKVYKWEATATYYVMDDTIGKDVFERHLVTSGSFIGIGQFRPRNGGFCGRFEVVKIEWSEA